MWLNVWVFDTAGEAGAVLRRLRGRMPSGEWAVAISWPPDSAKPRMSQFRVNGAAGDGSFWVDVLEEVFLIPLRRAGLEEAVLEEASLEDVADSSLGRDAVNHLRDDITPGRSALLMPMAEPDESLDYLMSFRHVHHRTIDLDPERLPEH